MTGRTSAEDAEFRAFVRTHHPDVGGDPAVFAAGLAARGRGARAAGPPITVVPGRTMISRMRRLRRAFRRRPSRSTPLR